MSKAKLRYVTRVVLPYGAFAALWIYLYDRALAALVTDAEWLTRLQTYKGLAFVCVTSFLLYWLVRHELAEREHAEDEQTRLRDRVFGILESMTDGFVALDRAWRYQYVNRRAAEMLGRPQEQLIGKHIWEEFPEGEGQDFYHAYQRVMKTQQAETIEEYYPPWRRWFENRIYPSPDGLHIFFQEITERKQAEAWREGQSRVLGEIVAEHPLQDVLETLIHTIESQATGALGSIMLLDADGRHLRYGAGPSLPTALGSAIDGMEIGPTAGACGTAAHSRQLVIIEDFQTDPRGTDYRALAARLNLHACWSQPVFSASGQVLGTFAMYYNEPRTPTREECKLIEEAGHLAAVAIDAASNRSALVASEMRFRATFEQAAVGIAHVSAEGQFLRINQKFCDIVGYTREEMLAGTFQNITYPDDLDADLGYVQRVLAGEIATYSMEKRYRRKDGSLVWVSLTVALVHKEDGTPDYFISAVKDISERKRVAEELRQSEHRLRALIDGLGPQMFVGLLTLDGIVVEANRSALTAAGLKPEDVLGRPFEETYWWSYSEEIKQQLRAAVVRAAHGEASRYDVQIRVAENQFIILDFSVQPLRDEIGGVVLLVPSAMVITERKQAEHALQVSEERLRLALDAAHMGIFDWDVPHNRITWSRWHEELWGFKPGEFGGTYEAFSERLHPDDLPGINTEVARRIAAREPFVREFRVVWPDGSIHWINARGEFTFGADGQPLRMRGAVVEITARKQAEAALSEIHARLKKVLEVETVGVMFWDLTTGCMTDANDTFLNIMGYSRRDVEARELTWQKLTPPEYFEMSLAETQKFQTTGRIGPYEKEYLRKDGTRQWFVFAGSSLGGNTCVEFCVDISERKRTELELQEGHRQLEILSRRLLAAQETERRHIARELHDEIGQLLTVVKLDLQTVLRQTGIKELSPALRESMDAIDRVIARVRDLSLDLRPSLLDDLGLAPALRWLAQRQAQRLGATIDLDLPPATPRLPGEVETACFRIVQEALTNAARHADAKTIHIALTLHTDSIELTIGDDGKGFDLALARAAGREGCGFGLLSMQERAELAGGQLTIISAPGHGATVTARFPMPETGRNAHGASTP